MFPRFTVSAQIAKELVGYFTTKFIRRPYHAVFVQPPHNETPKDTLREVIKSFSKEMGETFEYSPSGKKATVKRAQEMSKMLATLKNEPLPPRKMQDSYVSVIIPLKTDATLRELYNTHSGNLVRVGRLLEDLDFVAAYTCFKHIMNPQLEGSRTPYVVVTASVDTIRFARDQLNPTEDLRLSGHVTYVGKSSMEASVVVDQRDENQKYQKCFDAVFVMVARDPLNKSAVMINPLAAETKEEKEFLKLGAERHHKRKTASEIDLYHQPPTEEEIKIVHNHFVRKYIPGAPVNDNMKKMSGTEMRTVCICQPQNRNMFNKVFGGFIMRKAFELAFANTSLYCHQRPYIANIHSIKFYMPVEIGNILRFRSQIGYVKNSFVHTFVVAEIMDLKTGTAKLSNEFHFTFATKESDNPPSGVDYETYEEAIKFLSSRRHFKAMMDEFGTPSWVD